MNCKKTILTGSVLSTLLFFCSTESRAQQQNNFTLSGNAKGMEGQWLFLSCKGWNAERVWDSVIITNGKFIFSGHIDAQWKCYLAAKKSERLDANMTIPLYMVPGKMTIDVVANKFSDAILKGSPPEDEYIALERQRLPVFKKLQALYASYDSLDALNENLSDPTLLTAVSKSKKINLQRTDSLYKLIISFNKIFVLTHPASVAAVCILEEYKKDYRGSELSSIFEKLSQENRETPWGERIAEEADRRAATAEGTSAPDFSAQTAGGDTITLSNYKGKFVLLYFWASWSSACRQEFREIKALYEKYKDSGFEVIGISADIDEAQWLHAINYEGIGIWKNILASSNKPAIAKLYGTASYPAMMLLNKSGIIVKNFSTENDDEELPQVLSKYIQ